MPGPDELLVRVRAAGVNPGDWRLREGSYGTVGPAVLGREVAGTVAAVGPDVTGFAVGDEVFGGCPGMVGGWAEQALVVGSFAAHRPEAVPPDDRRRAAGRGRHRLRRADEPRASGRRHPAGQRGRWRRRHSGRAARAVPRSARSSAWRARPSTTFSPVRAPVPVAYGDGVLDRVRAAAPGGLDAVFDLVGGDALRTVAELLADRSRLLSVADKRAGARARRARGRTGPEHRCPQRARAAGRRQDAGPARNPGPPIRRGGRSSRAGRERARRRQGCADPVNTEPATCEARYGIMWGAMGAARDAYESACATRWSVSSSARRWPRSS